MVFYDCITFPKLETFNLNACQLSRNEMVGEFLEKHPQLKSISITNCEFITIEIIDTIAEKTSQIESVTFLDNVYHNIPLFSHANLLYWTKLKVLKINAAPEAIKSMIKNILARPDCPLECLSVWDYEEIPEEVIAAFNKLKKVEIVYNFAMEHDVESTVQRVYRHTHSPIICVEGSNECFDLLYGDDHDEHYKLAFLHWDQSDHIWHQINGLFYELRVEKPSPFAIPATDLDKK